MPDIEIRLLGAGDDAIVERAGNLFDKPPIPAATAAFLAAPDHNLFIAFVGGEPAGFVSGVEMIHPDKGTEMFLYELGVDEAFRGRGIGAALVEALVAHARERGNYGMWALTDHDNEAAIATYRRAGASDSSDNLLLEWRFTDG
ncbi:MAG: GNAT family N-acetyltransferase [Chloroflexota bacterium]